MNNDPNNSDIIYAIWAVIGWIAHELQNYLDNKKITPFSLAARAFVAWFSWVMLAHVAQHFFWTGDISMIAGWLGWWMWPWALQFIQFVFAKYFKYDEK